MAKIKSFSWKFPDKEVQYKYVTLSLNDLLNIEKGLKWRDLLPTKGCEAERKAKRKARLIAKDLLKMIGDDIVDNSYEVILPRKIGSLKVKDYSEMDTKINKHLYEFNFSLQGAYPDLLFKIDPQLNRAVQYFDEGKSYVGHLTAKLRNRAIENMINGFKYP